MTSYTDMEGNLSPDIIHCKREMAASLETWWNDEADWCCQDQSF